MISYVLMELEWVPQSYRPRAISLSVTYLPMIIILVMLSITLHPHSYFDEDESFIQPRTCGLNFLYDYGISHLDAYD